MRIYPDDISNIENKVKANAASYAKYVGRTVEQAGC
jgi:hypothetical protein